MAKEAEAKKGGTEAGQVEWSASVSDNVEPHFREHHDISGLRRRGGQTNQHPRPERRRARYPLHKRHVASPQGHRDGAPIANPIETPPRAAFSPKFGGNQFDSTAFSVRGWVLNREPDDPPARPSAWSPRRRGLPSGCLTVAAATGGRHGGGPGSRSKRYRLRNGASRSERSTEHVDHIQKRARFLKRLVGATGIEPVTPPV